MHLPREQKDMFSYLTGGFFVDWRKQSLIQAVNTQKRSLGGIEPPTSPTLKENHIT